MPVKIDLNEDLRLVDDRRVTAMRYLARSAFRSQRADIRIFVRETKANGPVREAGALPITDPLEAEGADWVGAVWPGDCPAPDAYQMMVAGLPPDTGVIYADDVDGEGQLRLKPCFDPLLLEGLDYLGRAVLFRPGALGLAGIAALAAGSAPVDVLENLAERRVAHLPIPLFSHGAVETTRVAPRRAAGEELISVIMPNRNSAELVRRAAEGVLNGTDWPALELIIVDNGSDDPATFKVYDDLRADARVRIDIKPAPFNFAAMVNRGAALARGGRLLLLNNDIEVIGSGWLREMASVLAAPGIGIVGAKLLFPDLTIQHAGVIVGHGGVAGHDMKGMARGAVDPLGRMAVPHRRSAVTAAAMLVERAVWDALEGFDAGRFGVAFNDVDFCLRAGAQGWGTALAPAAELIHHEGKSRRGRFSFKKALAHWRERAHLRSRHGTAGMIDPYESPWRDPERLEPDVRMLRQPPGSRMWR